MQTIKIKNKVPVPFTEGEMAGCYDTSCDGCNGPDCFLNTKNTFDENYAFWYSGNSIDYDWPTKQP